MSLRVPILPPVLAPSSATPHELLLGSMNHPCLGLRQPLRLTITRDGPLVVAHASELEEFGYGPHLTSAVEDFRQTLLELYQTPKTESDRLGSDLTHLWRRLQSLIEER